MTGSSGGGELAGERPAPGFSVVELLVALVLMALVMRSAATVLASQLRAAESLVLGSEALETGRIAGRVLHRELRAGSPDLDWWLADGDSVALRAYRGLARPCPGPPGAGISVLYRGIRNPDPGKDSVLVLDGEGRWQALELASSSAQPGSCGGAPDPGEEAFFWSVPGLPAGAVLLRVFERGSYHLSGGALRYRAGAAGRQPLTLDRLWDPGSELTLRGRGAADLRLAYREVPGRSRPTPDARSIWARDGR
ncbi:MAG TPA: hypothetical protein VLL48_00120 [Longimicrobiales bacterium]|nr:hypothetical protein [Longimicrobiales bacterium]